MSLSYGLVGASPPRALVLGLLSSWSHSCAHPPQPLGLGAPATAGPRRAEEAPGLISTVIPAAAPAPRAGSQSAEETLRLISAVSPQQLLQSLCSLGLLTLWWGWHWSWELEGRGHAVELPPLCSATIWAMRPWLLWEQG